MLRIRSLLLVGLLGSIVLGCGGESESEQSSCGHKTASEKVSIAMVSSSDTDGSSECQAANLTVFDYVTTPTSAFGAPFVERPTSATPIATLASTPTQSAQMSLGAGRYLACIEPSPTWGPSLGPCAVLEVGDDHLYATVFADIRFRWEVETTPPNWNWD